MSKRDDKPDARKCTGRTVDGRPCGRAPIRGTTRCAAHGYKPPGRPSKLTAELTDRVVQAVLEGNYLETAAQAAGISPSTLHRWLRRATDAEARAMELATDDELEEKGSGAIYTEANMADWPYLDFRHALKAAEAYAETELLRMALRGSDQPWQAYMTALERRHPDRWGRRDTSKIEHSGEVRRTVEVIAPSDDERAAAVARRLSEAGALEGAAGDENTP